MQAFNTDLFTLQGQTFTDPDFTLLRISAGTGFALPSPGHRSFTQMSGGWAVDSFFDINYRIDFIGSVRGPFVGMSASTSGMYHFVMCHSIAIPTHPSTWGQLKSLHR